MKIYINFNTEKGKDTANSFEKNFFKLITNSLYGKTMENLQKRFSFRVVNNEKNYLKHVSKSTFISTKIFDKNYAAIYEFKTVLTLSKTITTLLKTF